MAREQIDIERKGDRRWVLRANQFFSWAGSYGVSWEDTCIEVYDLVHNGYEDNTILPIALFWDAMEFL